jgi:hypothetical protein
LERPAAALCTSPEKTDTYPAAAFADPVNNIQTALNLFRGPLRYRSMVIPSV